MIDMEQIKNRINKLMAVAGDGIATEGEVNNAMDLAMKLIDKHNLDMAEFEKKEQREEKIEYGKVQMNYSSKIMNHWEGQLALAICKLFGTVSCYRESTKSPFRHNGVVQLDNKGDIIMTPSLQFYGPINDTKEAADLFRNWTISIGTMALTRWGGIYKGAGASYCEGFVKAIYEKVSQLDTSRQLTMATKYQLGDSTTAITLMERYKLIKTGARQWLNETQGVRLSKSHVTTSRNNNQDAYSEGFSHGKSTSFGRNAKNDRKMLS